MANYSMAHHKTYWIALAIIVVIMTLLIVGLFFIRGNLKQWTGI